MNMENKLLKMYSPSEGFFQLNALTIDEISHWQGWHEDAFIIPEGEELVIRKNGKFVELYRRNSMLL